MLGEVGLLISGAGGIVQGIGCALLREVGRGIARTGRIGQGIGSALLLEIGSSISWASGITQGIGHALIHTIQQSDIGITHTRAIQALPEQGVLSGPGHVQAGQLSGGVSTRLGEKLSTRIQLENTGWLAACGIVVCPGFQHSIVAFEIYVGTQRTTGLAAIHD